jgi:6-phosphogluconolactonase
VTKSRFEVFEDAAALAAAAAEHIAIEAARSIATRDRFGIALAGGSTPRATYERLRDPVFENTIDWSRVHVFFGDERAVPPSHPDSNYGMSRLALLDHVPIEARNVHPMRGDGDDLDAAAREYEAALAPFSPLDLVLLGLGEDGHTASIFGDVVAQCAGPERVVAVRSRAAIARGVPRLTLTYPAIESARRTLLLVSGAGKADVVRRVLDGDASLPATRVVTAGATLLLDLAAAAKI